MNVDPLEAFVDETIRQAVKHEYRPRVFIRMREKHGTVGAISKLVQSGEIQSGFKRLKELGILQWSIESAVVKFPSYFSKDDLECAEFRLSTA